MRKVLPDGKTSFLLMPAPFALVLGTDRNTDRVHSETLRWRSFFIMPTLIFSLRLWSCSIHSLPLEISNSLFHFSPFFYSLPGSQRGLASSIYDHWYALPIWRADRVNPRQLISGPSLSSQCPIFPTFLCYHKKLILPYAHLIATREGDKRAETGMISSQKFRTESWNWETRFKIHF